MRVLAIGDPHGDIDKINGIPLDGADLVLMTGDLGRADILRKIAYDYLGAAKKRSMKGTPQAEEFRRAFLNSYSTAVELVQHAAGHSRVFTVTGNADITNYDTRKFAATFGIELPFLYDALAGIKNVRILDNRLALHQGLRIGGIRYFTDMSWAEEFELAGVPKIRDHALRDTARVRSILERFGRVDILISHVPPYGVLDRVESRFIPPAWTGRHAGSKVLLEYIQRYQPRYVFCGHIHEAEGSAMVGATQVVNLGKCGHWTGKL